MHRNLDRRIEVLARLGSAAQTKHLGWLFDLAFDEGTSTWHLGPDGRWTRVHLAADGTPLVDVQSTLIARQARRSSPSS
jgi:polyphosphate kinase